MLSRLQERDDYISNSLYAAFDKKMCQLYKMSSDINTCFENTWILHMQCKQIESASNVEEFLALIAI